MLRTHRVRRRLGDRELVVLIVCGCALAAVLGVGLALWGDEAPGGRLQGHRIHCQRQEARLMGDVRRWERTVDRRFGQKRAVRVLLRDLSAADPSCRVP